MTPISIAVLGCGARMQHVLRNLLRETGDRAQVVSVFDPDADSIQRLDEILDRETTQAATGADAIARADWVFIGSPNAHHARQAIAALEAGKHVFCEKPLATNLDDCLAVRDAVARSGKTFCFGLVLRFAPLYRKIHELLAAGAIGRIVSFEFNETLGFNHGGYIFGNWRRHRAEAGTHLLEKCCHDLDLANWLVDSLPVRVASFGGRDFFTPANRRHAGRIGADARGRQAYETWADPNRVDPFSGDADILDNQVAILEYANGVRATFHTNCNAGIPERRFYICGTEGALRGDLYTGRIELQRIAHEPRLETFTVGDAGMHGGGDEVMARSLAASLLDAQPPLATVEDGLRACLVAFALDEAADTGRNIDLRPLWKRAGISL